MNKDDLKEDSVVTEPTDTTSNVEEPINENSTEAVEIEVKVEEPAAEASANSAEAEEPIVEAPEVQEQQPSEAEVYRDRLIRLQADFDNYRKRMARDKADMIKSANADLLSAMLPALDHIDHALASLEKTVAAPAEGSEAAPAEPNPYIEGFKLIQNELLRGLDKFGLKPIEVLGKPFDVEYHEALSKMPSDSVAPEHVLFEVRKGYTLNGKVLRAAQVIVSAAAE